MFPKQLMSSLAAILLSCARFQGQEAANLVNKAVLATAQHLSTYLSWLMTAKPAGALASERGTNSGADLLCTPSGQTSASWLSDMQGASYISSCRSCLVRLALFL